MPYEPHQTNPSLETWCPLPLQQSEPPKPNNNHNMPPYPNNNNTTTTTTTHPKSHSQSQHHPHSQSQFQPCLSPCSKTNNPSDCCTGRYNSPDACRPSPYSRLAKAVCPDAYSYAYDDRKSTFVVPSAVGGGWEVRFCPRGGRSTDILGTFAVEVGVIGAGGRLSAEGWGRVRSWEFVEGRGREGNGVGKGKGGSLLGVLMGWGVVGFGFGWLRENGC
jgi:hypothetical protein